jgi:hypothetical protein
VVYDDTFRFVPLDPSVGLAKVCTEDLCCLADFSFEMTDDVFSLGVFSGNHTKDGSVAGSFYIEMCTVMKCDPRDVPGTCEQYEIKDHDFLTSSGTVFQQLGLSGTFSQAARVFPEALFDGARLIPEQVTVSEDGVLGAGPGLPLLSLSLFGRRYSQDSPAPGDFCPT